MADRPPQQGCRPVLVGNISGSTGDRLDAMKCMLRGTTKVDALIGDWLSEVNLASRSLEMREGDKPGYEGGFLHSLKLAMDEYLGYRNPRLKVVVNAGGLNPKGMAQAVQKLLQSRGCEKKVAYVLGDNLLSKVDDLNVEPLTRSTGSFQAWRKRYPDLVLASAYIGCWGIVQALNAGADIVICGRCTDASTVMGVAAWWHGWSEDDLSQLASCLVAGHLIECGPYVTGGNYGDFQRLSPDYYDLSYPIAEIASDGTSIIQKHENQNGVVNLDTVRGQFLYELQGTYYYNPDVIADLSSIQLEQLGKNKVHVSGIKGIRAPETLKIAIMAVGGYQAEFSVYLTGLQTREKAQSFETMSRRMLDETKLDYLDFQLYGTPEADPKSQLSATLQLRVLAQAKHPAPLQPGKFLGPLMSNQLSGYPGLTANFDYRTATPKRFCTYFPGLIHQCYVQQTVHVLLPGDDEQSHTEKVTRQKSYTPIAELPAQKDYQSVEPLPSTSFGPTRKVPFGYAVFARSGDKGANVNVGFFIPTRGSGSALKQASDWLRSVLSTEKLRELLAEEATPETYIERCEFPKIGSVHFVIHGILGAGVSSSMKMDSLGKNVAEYLRARHVDVPVKFLPSELQPQRNRTSHL